MLSIDHENASTYTICRELFDPPEQLVVTEKAHIFLTEKLNRQLGTGGHR